MSTNTKWKNRKRELIGRQSLLGRVRNISHSDIWPALIPALALFICSLILSIQGQSDARTGVNSLGWNVTCGEVVSTDVVCNRHVDSRRSSNSSTSCAAVVTYRYHVRGTEYRGKRFRIAADGADAYSSGLRADCEEWGKKNYRPGKEVRVHYDPREPGEAALVAGVSSISKVFVIIGSLLAGPTCFMALFAVPGGRRPSVVIRLLISLALMLLAGAINYLAFPAGVAGEFSFEAMSPMVELYNSLALAEISQLRVAV